MPYARSMSAPKLVIRSHAPVRKILFWVLAGVAMMGAGFGLYVAGQSRAGFNRIQTEREIAALRNELVGQRAENLALREKIALLDTAAKIDSEAYRRVEAGLVDLQSKILDQQEDIAFYRGIVSPDDTAGLRIQNFSLSRAIDPRTFNMQLVLAQAFRSDRQVTGHVELSIEGVRQGEPVRLGLGELLADEGPPKPPELLIPLFSGSQSRSGPAARFCAATRHCQDHAKGENLPKLWKNPSIGRSNRVRLAFYAQESI